MVFIFSTVYTTSARYEHTYFSTAQYFTIIRNATRNDNVWSLIVDIHSPHYCDPRNNRIYWMQVSRVN